MAMRPLCGICGEPNNPISRLFAEQITAAAGTVTYRPLPLTLLWFLEGLGAIVGIDPHGCHPATIQSVPDKSGGRTFETDADGNPRPWYEIQREKKAYLQEQAEASQQAQPQQGIVLGYGKEGETLDESGLGPGLYNAPLYEWTGQEKPKFNQRTKIEKPPLPEEC